MSTLGDFLAAIAVTIALCIAGHFAYMGNYGGNFNPGAGLDTSQVIDAIESHGLHTQ